MSFLPFQFENNPCEFSAQFNSNKSVDQIIETVAKVLECKKGKVLERTTDSIRVVLGSRLILRLFGAWILSEYTKRQLPTQVYVTAQDQGKGTMVTLCLVDNMGQLIIRDPFGRKAYQQYFGRLARRPGRPCGTCLATSGEDLRC